MSRHPTHARHATDISSTSAEKNGSYGAPSVLDDGPGSGSSDQDVKHPYDADQKDREMAQAEFHSFDNGDEDRRISVVTDAKDIVTSVLHVEDDPTLNPWTFRMIFLGLGLTAFGAVLQEIYYFKPQTIFISVIFLTVIAYVLGEGMALLIPGWGPVGRFLNPHPFNSKEHAAIVIMSSAASQCAFATETLAVQKLYYGANLNHAASVFIIISSQILGLAMAGLLRRTLIFPTKMLWPINLPMNTLLETLHRDKKETKKRLKIFYIAFFCFFIWETLPEYIMPVLTGVSVFCFAKQNNLVFTNLFGGAQGNEGMGFLSICLDWQFIASTGSPLWVPLQTLVNSCIGAYLCVALFMGLYYGIVWRALSFPFMSQLLYSDASTQSSYVTYNQTAILNSHNQIEPAAVAQQGLPNLTATYLGYLITTNMGLSAAVVHILLFNYKDVASGWSFLSLANLKKLTELSSYRFWDFKESEEQKAADRANPDLDPHYKLLLNYKQVPQWWWVAVLVASFVIALVCIYVLDSTLPWWGYIISVLLGWFMILFFGVQMAMSYQSVWQGQLLLKDLKLAQFAHLSPRSTFFVQLLGSTAGAIFNYIMMVSIVDNQAPALLSIEGTNIWSGQNLQQYNTLAIACSMAHEMFSVDGKYQWVTIAFLLGFIAPLPLYFAYRLAKPGSSWRKWFAYFNTSIILWYAGYLFVGVNSSILMYFVCGFIGQGYIRKYHPKLFIEYNYLVSAALDGGMQVIVFILSFAVDGASGKAVSFPTYWGNTGDANGKNLDYCMINPANG